MDGATNVGTVSPGNSSFGCFIGASLVPEKASSLLPIVSPCNIIAGCGVTENPLLDEGLIGVLAPVREVSYLGTLIPRVTE